MQAKTSQRATHWTLALVYTALIYTFAWFVIPLWDWLTGVLGTEKAGIAVDRTVPLLGALLLVLVLARFRLPKLSSYVWLIAVASGYIYMLTLHAEYPVERAHLITYSLVAWVYFRALRLDCRNRVSYTLAGIAVFLIGLTDELIQQYAIPERSGTFEDMIINWSAGLLGLIGLLAIRREGFWELYARFGKPVKLAAGHALPVLLTVYWSHQVYTRYLYPPLNLLIITVDCARPDRMSVYGHEADKPTTAYLDKIAEDGAVFTNAYSQAAWTGPGVMSTLTGLYPATHGVTAQGKTLPKSVHTLLDAFKEHGYRVPNLSYLTVDPTFQNIADMEETGIDVTTANEVAAIRRWIGGHHREPIAMWYHWRFTHLPYNPPRKHWKYPPANPEDGVRLKDFPQPDNIKNIIRKEVIIPYYSQELLDDPAPASMSEKDVGPNVEFTAEDTEWINALYDAQMRHFDHAFESLRYKLALHHKLKHTIIVITADHGEELMDHGFVGHASTAVHSRHYNEQLHLPLLIMAPRVIKQGRRLDLIAQQIDIMPTVLDMMGWDIPEGVQGRSLLPAIRGETMEELPTYAESVEGGYQAKPYQRSEFVRSIRTKDWSFIARMSPRGDELELYNLVDDPAEMRNVIDDHPQITGGFIQQLSRWITLNIDDRIALEKKEALQEARTAAMDPANLSVPTVTRPSDGDTIYYGTMDGAIAAEWTGNPHAAYIIEYDIGENWHRLKGKYPVEMGTEQIFGPIPRDAWKPLHQWNPYKVRVRPRDLPNAWSEWITIDLAPLDATNGDD